MWVKEICQQVELGLEGWIGLKTRPQRKTSPPQPLQSEQQCKDLEVGVCYGTWKTREHCGGTHPGARMAG